MSLLYPLHPFTLPSRLSLANDTAALNLQSQNAHYIARSDRITPVTVYYVSCIIPQFIPLRPTPDPFTRKSPLSSIPFLQQQPNYTQMPVYLAIMLALPFNQLGGGGIARFHNISPPGYSPVDADTRLLLVKALRTVLESQVPCHTGLLLSLIRQQVNSTAFTLLLSSARYCLVLQATATTR